VSLSIPIHRLHQPLWLPFCFPLPYQIAPRPIEPNLPATVIGLILKVSLITAFKYGNSCVFCIVIASLISGNAVSISATRVSRAGRLVSRRWMAETRVIAVVSLPPTLNYTS
jgi:hypothetical protein